jgi:type III pantothenate kinase
MTPKKSQNSTAWLALMIGNSRLHWGYFKNRNLHNTWDTYHCSQSINDVSLLSDFLPDNIPDFLPLILASVVPSQTQLWSNYHNINIIDLEDIPINNLYSTIGIDRVLAVLGAGKIYGFPCLVIDAGTALTITGVDRNQTLIGGAILPGLKLQFDSLSTKTAALPKVNLPDFLPSRWAMNTPDGINSGILYTILSGIKSFIDDWLHKYPRSKIILTGGDSLHLYNYFQQQSYPQWEQLTVDENIIFWGMQSLIPLQ